MKNKLKKSIPELKSLKQWLFISLIVFCISFSALALILADKIIKEVSSIQFPDASIIMQSKIEAYVHGYPIVDMAPYIAKQDRKTAAFLLGIAKKESNWGVHYPKLDGRDCYNYWGFRGDEGEITWDGYSCFSSPEEAVRTVGSRIHYLIYDAKLDTARKMVVWKCGQSCAAQNPVGVSKWIRDVNMYFQKFYE